MLVVRCRRECQNTFLLRPDKSDFALSSGSDRLRPSSLSTPPSLPRPPAPMHSGFGMTVAGDLSGRTLLLFDGRRALAWREMKSKIGVLHEAAAAVGPKKKEGRMGRCPFHHFITKEAAMLARSMFIACENLLPGYFLTPSIAVRPSGAAAAARENFHFPAPPPPIRKSTIYGCIIIIIVISLHCRF